jgi:hypothetical protein
VTNADQPFAVVTVLELGQDVANTRIGQVNPADDTSYEISACGN